MNSSISFTIKSENIDTLKSPLNIPTQNQKEEELIENFDTLNFSSTWNAKKILVIPNAHQDDIHGMIRLSGDRFVTGSKDGNLKIWSNEGKIFKEVLICNTIDYEKWITALAPVDNKRWMSGSRDGQVKLWNDNGELICALNASPGNMNFSQTSKQRNLERINSLTAKVTRKGDIYYYVGRPSHFTVHKLSKNGKEKNLRYCKTSHNDWVYCVEPLTPTKALVVTGDKLGIWLKKQQFWKLSTSLIDPPYIKDKPLPFISAMTRLLHQPKSCFGLAIFDGSVACLDLESKQLFFKATEHDKRVWMIENISQHIFASCGDDHTIKIWDIRAQQKSQLTLTDNIGRVSTLLKIADFTLVSGSCPDHLKFTKERANLTFWDIRC